MRVRNRLQSLLAAVTASIALVSVLPHRSFAAPITGAEVIVSYPELTGTVGGVFSTYTYHQPSDSYYVGVFGSTQGLLRVTRNSPGDPWVSDAYVESRTGAFPSDMLRFIRSSDVAGGVVDANDYGTSLISGLLLNPAPLTIAVPEADAAGNLTGGTTNITYQTGELAFITDGGADVRIGGSSGTKRFDWTKKLYRWDLREIGAATTDDPDYSTGTSGVASDPNPGGIYGAVGQADWNDVFTVAMTEEAMRNAYTAATGNAPSASSSDNISRQPAWSTDGQHLYAVDSGTVGGGLYKINAASGATELIYSEDGGGNIIAEPAVVHTSTRDFGAGFGAGDQILFDGNSNNGNPGGISYVVDTGSSVSGIQTLFTGSDFSAYTGISAQDVDSIASDSSGNIYLFEGATDSIHMLDTAGRFRSVLNRAQLFEVNETHDGRRANSGTLLRFQIREEGGETRLTYRGDNSYLGAVQILDGGDVNRDGVVDQSDKDFFVEQFNKTFHTGAPNPYDANDPGLVGDYIDYINADLNGDSDPRAGTDPTSSSATSQNVLPGLDGGGVDYLDLLVIGQFIDLELGDFDWDGEALTDDDWTIFNTHYQMDPASFGYNAFSWFDGDVTGSALDGTPDGLVNEFDLQFLLMATAVPEPGTWALMLVSLAGFGYVAYRRRTKRRGG